MIFGLDGSEWSTSHSERFILVKESNWIVGWVGPRYQSVCSDEEKMSLSLQLVTSWLSVSRQPVYCAIYSGLIRNKSHRSYLAANELHGAKLPFRS